MAGQKRRETDDLHKSGAGAVPAVAGTGHRADAARPGRARGGDLLPHRAAARAADAGKCVPCGVPCRAAGRSGLSARARNARVRLCGSRPDPAGILTDGWWLPRRAVRLCLWTGCRSDRRHPAAELRVRAHSARRARVRRCARAAADEGRLLQHTHSLTARRRKDDAAARVRAPVVRPRAAHLAYGRARRDRGGAKPDAAVRRRREHGHHDRRTKGRLLHDAAARHAPGCAGV